MIRCYSLKPYFMTMADSDSSDTFHYYSPVVLLFLGICLALPQNLFPETAVEPVPVFAVEGQMDLSKHDFTLDGPVALDGEWEFYWRTFPGDDEPPWGDPRSVGHFVTVPSFWSKYSIDGQNLPTYGYATYVLNLKLASTDDFLGLAVPEIMTAFEIRWNGRLVVKRGIIGRTKDETDPESKPGIIAFDPGGSNVRLEIRVANFHHRRCGLGNGLVLGTLEQVQINQEVVLSIDTFVFGSLLMIGIYHLFFYFFRRKDVSPLYFGLFCLALSWRMIATTGLSIHPLTWMGQYISRYISFYLSVPLFAAYLQSIFPWDSPRVIFRWIKIVGMIAAAFVILTPVYIFSYSLEPFIIYTVLSGLVCLWVLTRAIRNRRDGAIVFTIAFCILFGVAVNDMCHSISIIQTGFFAPIGLLVFILFQVHILARRYVGALSLSEELTDEMESKVELRTKEYQKAINLAEKAALEADTANKAMSTFLSIMSHELRTPLNGVIGMASLLRDTKLSTRQLEYIGSIEGSCSGLLVLISDILDYSRMESGKIEIERMPFSLLDCIFEACESIGALATVKGLDLACEIRPELPEIVVGDPSRLRQIIVNLVNNAVKFTEHGSIVLCVALKALKSEEALIEISVKDTGIGIPEDQFEFLFQPFSQIDSSTTRRFGGTGLGLVISRRLANLMGGEIGLTSETGRGSTFNLTLRVGVPMESSGLPVYGENRKGMLSGCTVLLIESSSENSAIIGRYITQWGGVPILVKRPELLNLKNLKDRVVDVILVNSESYARIKEHLDSIFQGKPEPVHKVVLLHKFSQKSKHKGVLGHLSKPVRPNELFRVLRQAMSDKGVEND